MHNQHNVSGFVVESTCAVLPSVNRTLFFEEFSSLLIKYSNTHFKNDDHINFVHQDLDDASFVWYIGWELVKAKDNGFLHSGERVQEIAVEAIVQYKCSPFRKTYLWIWLINNKDILNRRAIFAHDQVRFLEGQVNEIIIPKDLSWKFLSNRLAPIVSVIPIFFEFEQACCCFHFIEHQCLVCGHHTNLVHQQLILTLQIFGINSLVNTEQMYLFVFNFLYSRQINALHNIDDIGRQQRDHLAPW